SPGFVDAAAVVLTTDGHAGAVYELGGERLNYTEPATVLSDIVGLPVAHKDLPKDDYAKIVENAEVPAQFAEVLAESDAGIAVGALDTDSEDPERLIGRPATSAAVAIGSRHPANPVESGRVMAGSEIVSSANLTRAETAARARALDVHAYRVELDLRGAVDPRRTGFPTVTTLEFTASADETWLDFIGDSVESVTVNGELVPVVYDGARIIIGGLKEINVVTVVATGRYSRSGEGLHRFVDPVDGETYLYTQYEPADARRVFVCFEQPDLKAPFTFVVTAPVHWELLSNESADARVQRDDIQTVTFAPTQPIATYITAVVAGPYHRVDSSWT